MPAQPRQIGGGQHELAAAVDRLNEVVQEMRAMLAEIRQEIAEDRRTLEAKYLPRVEFTLTQATDAVQMRGLEGELHSLAKRQEATAADVMKNDKAAQERIREVEDRRRADRMWAIGIAVSVLALVVSTLLAVVRL